LVYGDYLTVIATVVEWLSLPAEPVEVPVIVTVPVIGGLELEQPTTTIRSTIAVASPTLTRSPLGFASRNSKSDARISGTICQIEMGGVRTGEDGKSRLPFVLVTTTGTDCAVIPSEAMTGVVMVQVVPIGAPVQVNATLWLNPPSGVMVALKVSGLFPVAVEGAVTWKSHPVPVRGIVCGLPRALSVNVRFPVSAPTAVGANVTLIVQVPDAASVAGLIGQLFV